MFKNFVFSALKQKSLIGLCTLLLVSPSLQGCDLARNQLKPDRGSNMETQDFRDGLAERTPEIPKDSAGNASIPSLQSYISSVPDGLKAMPLVSISVNQSVPLRDILYELAQQAEYDIELDPRISGSIIFTVREKPFDLVIKRIADISNLRYRFSDGILRVELDTPYNKVYKVNYLNYVRTNTGAINNNISVVSGDGADTGSNFEAASESEADFWGEMEVNLEQLLGGGTTGDLKTDTDPRITAVDQNPQVQAVAPPSAGEAGVTVQPPDAVLRVESLPVDDGGAGGSTGGQGSEEEDLYEQSFTINKQAGLINVHATERTHEEVRNYLRVVERSTSAQVLIEAKIMEVELNDEYVTGIDWSDLGLFSGNVTSGFFNSGTLLGSFLPNDIPVVAAGTEITGNTNFAIGYAGNNIKVLVEALEAFGTVRALSSPRMTVLNNQSAVLNVATNRVFFELEINTTTGTAGSSSTINISSDIRNVPVGVLVNVQPSIDLENNTVSLALRPTITRVVSTKNDPAVAFAAATVPAAAGIVSPIPELNVQEIDSVIQVRSGQPIVMGGLLQDRATTSQEGLPVLSELPVLGALFRDHTDLIQKTELVIFLKATILKSPGDSIDDADRDIYRMFSGDRRPLRL